MAGRSIHTSCIRAASVALIMLLLMAASCDKEKLKEYIEIRLEIPISITSPEASISLGDTLWIISEFPDTLSDYISKQYLKVGDFSFYTSILLTKLVSKSLYETEQPAAAGAFDFYFDEGSISDIGSLGGKLNLKRQSNGYRIKFGLVPKFRGTYGIRFLYRSSENWRVPILDDDNNRIYVMYFMNYILNDGDFHFDLYEANVKTVTDLRAEPDFERKWSMYCFEVL